MFPLQTPIKRIKQVNQMLEEIERAAFLVYGIAVPDILG